MNMPFKDVVGIVCCCGREEEGRGSVWLLWWWSAVAAVQMKGVEATYSRQYYFLTRRHDTTEYQRRYKLLRIGCTVHGSV